jgi:DNA polymerase-1
MRTILLDGDIVAYQIACRNEVSIDWGDDVITKSTNMDEAKTQIDQYISSLKKMLGAIRVIICLTDSQNFRKDILPTYKANRKGVLKPALLAEVRKYLHESHEVVQRPGLEADDCMGILATMGDTRLLSGDRVIVSIDKDMKSIPGYLFNPMKTQQGVIEISLEEADLNHLRQTLIGDPVDNYSGCPGIGKTKAEKVLTKKHPDQNRWELVVKAFEAKGLTEADALVQARVARICRSEDYSFTNRKPILWNPPNTKKAVA